MPGWVQNPIVRTSPFLRMGPQNGLSAIILEFKAHSTANEMKQVLSTRLKIPVEVLQVAASDGTLIRGRDRLHELGLEAGNLITCRRLPIPRDYDYISECDSCDDVRHLYYTEWRRDFCSWEAVTAKCQACGGVPTPPPEDAWSVVEESMDEESGEESNSPPKKRAKAIHGASPSSDRMHRLAGCGA